MKTITKPMAKRIQAMIDDPEPMTHQRLSLLVTDSKDLTREDRIAGIAHVFRIADAALQLADWLPIRAEGPVVGVVGCSFCWATTTAPVLIGWHEDDCLWRHLVETIKQEYQPTA